MNNSVSEHYANHLGPIYSWMVGDFDAATESMSAYFGDVGLRVGPDTIAVDLGCGHGIQAVPLARLGYEVFAVDTCGRLLEELEAIADAEELPIHTINDDLLNFAGHLDRPVNVIVCMGDTLTHLESADHVAELIASVANALTADGVFCVSFRDYVSSELAGNDRFIPVRSDDDRIHTCFLEYLPDCLRVHDIIHTRSPNGWQMAASSYPKLRIAPGQVEAFATARGLQLIDRRDTYGMLYLAFKSTSG
ncbi:MAG: class I SAM-dependent methyltransferase [Pirellulaceae bacterium]